MITSLLHFTGRIQTENQKMLNGFDDAELSYSPFQNQDFFIRLLPGYKVKNLLTYCVYKDFTI